MEESVQQELQQEPEQPELEYKSQNEDQGDIRRRLRDRDLLKKRKAEAEEKDTDQWDFGTESPRKRGRSGAKRGRGRRGRPRKTAATVITDYQNETALDQDATATVTKAILDQTTSPLEAQLVLAAPTVSASVIEQVNPMSQGLVTTSESIVDAPPIQVQDMALAPDDVPLSVPPVSQEPLLLQPTYTESQIKPALDQILIEDLGPDEEEDLGAPEDKQVEKDLSEKPIITPEPTFLSNPTLSTSPPLEYVPGNSV